MLWPSSLAQWATRPDVQPLDASLPHRGFSMAVGSLQESWIYNTAGTSTAAGDLQIRGSGPGDIGIRRTGTGGSLERLVLQGDGRLMDGNGDTLLDLGGNAGVLEVAFTGTRADLSGTATAVGVRFQGPKISDVRHGGATLQWTRAGGLVTVTGP
jgi:hypothetical protein